MNFGLTSNPKPALSWKTFVLRYRSKAFVNWIVFGWLLDHVHLNLSWNGIAMLFWRTSAFLLVNMRHLVKTKLLNDYLSRTIAFCCLSFTILLDSSFSTAISYSLSLTMERHIVCVWLWWLIFILQAWDVFFLTPFYNEENSRIEFLMHFGGLFYYLIFLCLKEVRVINVSEIP